MSIATHATSLKRWFIAPYMVLNSAGLISSLVRAVISATGNGHQTAAWALAVTAHGAVLAFAPRSWPRRDSGLTGLLVITTAATIADAALLPDSAAALIQVAVIAWIGSLVYATWYSRFGGRSSPALVRGALLPELRLRTVHGDDFSTAQLRGAPAALFFFRGAWCPFCSAQIRTVIAGYEQLASRGVRVAMISPQPEKEARKLAAKFGVEILWLRDPGLHAARALGIADPGGVPAGAAGFGTDTVLPTLVVLDASGHVIAADETDTYRVRPTPDTVLNLVGAVQTSDRVIAGR